MSDHISRTNDELNSEEAITELNSEEETEVTKEPTLRERVFKVCDDFDREGIKITRDLVLSRTGGSCRDLSKYINEWRQTKGKSKNGDSSEHKSEGALVVQSPSSIEVQSSNEMVQEEKIQTIKTSVVKRQSKNAASVAMTSANRAAGVIIAEEKGFQYLLENPDQLPEELKQEVAKAISESDELMSERSARFELNFFTETVLSSFHTSG